MLLIKIMMGGEHLSFLKNLANKNSHIMKKVSICVPTYNGERYLEETLNSVLNQTYDDFEVIIVDDQSSDNTCNIAEHFANIDPRIYIHRNENNLGLVGNWNRCIELAQGEWIKFVFQDDIIRNDCLEIMMSGANPNQPLIFCRREFFFDASISDKTKKSYMDIPRIDDLISEANLISPSQVCHSVLTNPRNFFGEPTSTLIHRSVFDRFGLFNPTMVQLCDLEYWIRVGINTGIKYFSEPLVQFRVHSTSTSSKNNEVDQIYRSSHMDRLILLHEFAYNSSYEPIRKFTKETHPSRNFKKELAEKAFWLKNLANALPSPENNKLYPKDHWKYVTTYYPKIDTSIYLLPYKAQNWLQRNLLWRFRKN